MLERLRTLKGVELGGGARTRHGREQDRLDRRPVVEAGHDLSRAVARPVHAIDGEHRPEALGRERLAQADRQVRHRGGIEDASHVDPAEHLGGREGPLAARAERLRPFLR